MRPLFLTTLAIATLAAGSAEGQRIFTASEAKGAGLRSNGRVVLTNDKESVRAYEVDGHIERQLTRIAASRSIRFRSYGTVVYNGNAEVQTKAPADIAKAIRDASREHGVDPRLVTAVAFRESSFKPDTVSTAGACGIMQLMPATAKFLGVEDIFDVEQNIDGGVRYLRMLLESFGGDLELTLAAYNAGPGAVERYRGIPPYSETVNYVRNVKGDYERALKISS
ncbi:MAG: transglycosylase SLT domain-containing protein [Acidobacteria bacterium]|nr:transglycosylase SLT domain-containing protein [Acidobacteriota bacterium]